jgi:hypothetical protein
MTFNLSPSRAVALVALLLVAVPRAAAEPIQWTYQGQVVPTGPSSGNAEPPLPFGVPPNPHILNSAWKATWGISVDTTNFVEFADVSGSGSGSTSVTAFQMRSNTSYFDGMFSKDLHTFNLGFGIRDAASGVTGTVSFNGTLDGRMSGGLSNEYVDLQVGFTGALQKSLVLGNHLYKVSVEPFRFLWEQPSSTATTGPIVAPFQNVPINVLVSDVPEPSTLTLAAVGLAGIGLRAWRRRRCSPHRHLGR